MDAVSQIELALATVRSVPPPTATYDFSASRSPFAAWLTLRLPSGEEHKYSSPSWHAFKAGAKQACAEAAIAHGILDILAQAAQEGPSKRPRLNGPDGRNPVVVLQEASALTRPGSAPPLTFDFTDGRCLLLLHEVPHATQDPASAAR
jgi:hypothetical protein